MRKDVKFGMALALAVVVVAGWYYTRDSDGRKSIPLAGAGVSEPPVLSEQSISSEQPALSEQPVLSKQRKPLQTVDDAGPSVEKSIAHAPAQSAVTHELAASGSEAGEGAGDRIEKSVAKTPMVEREGSLLAAEPQVEKVSAGESAGLFDLASAFADGPKEPDDSDAHWVVRAPKPATATDEKPEAQAATPKRAAAQPRPQPKLQSSDRTDAVESYTVQPGDTFAVLAEIYYGSQQHAKFLMDANPQIKNPQQLRAGCTIRIPPLPQKKATATKTRDVAPKGKHRYTVKDGDSFYRIAQRELGKGSRWEELFELNKAVVKNDPQGLQPGMVLALPQSD